MINQILNDRSTPAAANTTRARLLDAARYLFWEKGYTATGMSEILGRAQANSGSFTISSPPAANDELDPDAMATVYWQLVCQERSAWTLELDLRPYQEKFFE